MILNSTKAPVKRCECIWKLPQGSKGGQIKVDALANDESACFGRQILVELARWINLLMAIT